MNRNLQKNQGSNIPGLAEIRGSITTASDSSVASQSPAGTLATGGFFTASKPAGTGIYKVAFDPVYAIVGASASIMTASGTLDAKVDPISSAQSASGGVQQFQVRKSSDGTALDPGACTLYFTLALRTSGVVQ